MYIWHINLAGKTSPVVGSSVGAGFYHYGNDQETLLGKSARFLSPLYGDDYCYVCELQLKCMEWYETRSGCRCYCYYLQSCALTLTYE